MRQLGYSRDFALNKVLLAVWTELSHTVTHAQLTLGLVNI